jgi:hypothetical protein
MTLRRFGARSEWLVFSVIDLIHSLVETRGQEIARRLHEISVRQIGLRLSEWLSSLWRFISQVIFTVKHFIMALLQYVRNTQLGYGFVLCNQDISARSRDQISTAN